MTSPLTFYKLVILYMLDRTDARISTTQFSAFLTENGYTNLLSLVRTFSEIEESGLVRVEESSGQTFLTITDEGRETLRFFADELGEETRRQADAYLREHGAQLRTEESVIADWYRATYGGYEVRLAVRERGVPVVELTMAVPDEGSAVRIAENWKKNNQEIYRSLIEKLF